MWHLCKYSQRQKLCLLLNGGCVSLKGQQSLDFYYA